MPHCSPATCKSGSYTAVPGCCKGWQAKGPGPGRAGTPARGGSRARQGLWPGRPWAVLKWGPPGVGGWSGPARPAGPPGPDTPWTVEWSLSILATVFRLPSRNQLPKMFPSDIFAARLRTSSAPFTYHKAEKGDALQLLLCLSSHIRTSRVTKYVLKLKE